jgi:hypothetical protein
MFHKMRSYSWNYELRSHSDLGFTHIMIHLLLITGTLCGTQVNNYYLVWAKEG